MADKNTDETPGPGRPQLFEEKQVRSSFSAPSGHIEFLRRVGKQNTNSAGIRAIIAELVHKDDRYLKLMKQIEEEGFDVGNIFNEFI